MTEGSGALELVARLAGEAAVKTATTLLRVLDEGEGKVRTVKDLSGVLKDLVSISRDLAVDGGREVEVRFSDETEEAAR